MYAAGALYGLARGFDLATCARLGSLAAAEVITHIGPRPHAELRALAREVAASIRRGHAASSCDRCHGGFGLVTCDNNRYRSSAMSAV